MNAVAASVPRAPPRLAAELRPPSRLRPAFWLALLVEAAIIASGAWMAEHRPDTQSRPAPAEQVRLVQLSKPVTKPKPKVDPHPKPQPVRHEIHAIPIPRIVPPPQPIALPPPAPLPLSPVASDIPAPPPAPAPVSASVKASYLGAVKSAIQAAVRFPADARMLRREGKVRVRFRLLDGVVTSVKIVTGGSLRSFDANALNAIRQAIIPSPPRALAHQVFRLVLWVKFDLHRSL